MGRVQTGLSPQIQQVRPHHRSMARALVAGLRPGEIAQAYGFSPGQISRIIQTPMFQAEVARLEAQAEGPATDLREDIRAMATKAMEVLDADLELEVGEDMRARQLRQKAAMDVLDRAGVSRGDVRVGNLTINQTKVDVHGMKTEDLQKDVFDLLGEEA